MKRNLKSPSQLAKDGPLSIDQWRWMIFNAKTNGLETAICRIGRRVYVDVDGFDAWLVTNNPSLRSVSGVSL